MSFLKSESLKNDIFAGLTVALILIPQSLAYAQLAGLSPQYGLYAALIPPVIAAFFGSSALLSTGPVAVLSLMTYASISQYAIPGSTAFVNYTFVLSFVFGLILFILGIARMGSFIGFLSHPVIYGFTNAAALIIASTQLPAFLGIVVPDFERQYQVVTAVLVSATTIINWPTFLLGIVSLCTLFILKKVDKKMPHILIVVAASAVVSYVFSYPTALVGEIPKGLPQLAVPHITFSSMSTLVVTALAMALIGFTESFSIAQALAVKTKSRLNPNKELRGQGLANLIGSLFQSHPVSGSLSRTALNYNAGGNSKLSGMFASSAVLITLLFFTPVLYYIPKVVLAAIIIFSVASLIDFSKFSHIWKVNKADGVAAFLTFTGTLLYAPDIEKGVILGVFFSIGYFMYRLTRPRVAFLSKLRDKSYHDARAFHLDRCENIAIVRLDAPLFFANAEYFENEIIKDLAEHSKITDILFVANGINQIDSTGEEMLSAFSDTLKESGKHIFMASVKAPVMKVLIASGFYKKIGKDHFFASTNDALTFLITHLRHEHVHTDAEKCPLILIRTPHKLHRQRSLRETVAYFYGKLLKH